MCIDYKRLHKIPKFHKYPIPNLQQLFDTIGHAQYLKIDLKSGFYKLKWPMDLRITEFCTYSIWSLRMVSNAIGSVLMQRVDGQMNPNSMRSRS